MRPTPILTLDELAYVLAERPERLNELAKTGEIPSAQTILGRVYNLNAVVDSLRRLNPPLTSLRPPRPQPARPTLEVASADRGPAMPAPETTADRDRP